MVDYLVVGATGLLLLFIVPESEIRWQQLCAKGGAAMLLGLGLYGSVYTMMSA